LIGPAQKTSVGSVGEAIGAAADALAAAGVSSPRLDAEVLLAEASGRRRARLLAEPGTAVEADAGRRFAEMVRRRLRREPVAYIIGHKGFRQIELALDPRVLIPRPESELLVELALERRPGSVLDLGTGSGAIALALADEMPECEVVATDTSPAALAVARANAERLGLSGRVRIQAGSLPPGRSFDLILANLPYVSDAEWASLEPEIARFEPREALLGGPDGLDVIRALIPRVKQGCLALEVGAGQAEEVVKLLRGAGFAKIRTDRDLAGIERVVVGERPQ